MVTKSGSWHPDSKERGIEYMLQDITSLKLMQRPTESTKRTLRVPRKVANSLFTTPG